MIQKQNKLQTWCSHSNDIRILNSPTWQSRQNDIRVHKVLNATFAFQIHQSESRLNIKWGLRFNTRRGSCPNIKWLSCLNIKQRSHLYWSLHLKKTRTTVTFSSTRDAFSLPKKWICLCFCNPFNSTLAKTIDNSIDSTVHRQDKPELR